MGRHKGFTVDDYQRLAHAGMTMSEAAQHMGVKPQTVWVMAKKHGITFAAGKRGRRSNAGNVQTEDPSG